ncbi:hypothetical protein PTSG_01079 [Salpingoeca rosetta]|uniref:Uncharacterized protein n=1 Tax=Salpingoeca rosetta (strain ATCC 50818 / BSB-021) TaxID=946362 RepID=F2TYB9_SALR5|nr:uncharacterized protein PTSG_01079 [Salpingoeca rosetta]EGD76378.1 hypothetical protein PTSG_01079 [Salpingoeca rosetta]|eukprot:XP_004998553.1 hypothetical protein PTSG_01079 [Salpingoeca rosetta]
MDWEEQLWTHTSMVMVGTSNHSDTVRRRSRPSSSSPSPPSTAQPPSHAGSHQPQSGVRQTLHMSVALMKSVEEAHEAVEPTTMAMTSDEAVPDVAALWMNGPSASGPSPPPRPRRRWSPTAAAAAMDMEPSPCDVELLRRDRDSRQHSGDDSGRGV